MVTEADSYVSQQNPGRGIVRAAAIRFGDW